MRIKRALISVSDKTGLEDMVKTLHKFGVEIISTGGTAKAIKAMQVPVKDISEYTGLPEMMDGRVKTLHPKIHGGLLALRRNPAHMDEAKRHNIGMIDMVIVNLYPFEKTIEKEGATLEDAIENIDIGGPSMLRSAAKNYRDVAVVTDPRNYSEIITELTENGGSLHETTLARLAVQVFERTSGYDGAISEFLKNKIGQADSSALPPTITVSLEKVQDLRYGENPHQRGAFYKMRGSHAGITAAQQLQGKELSFNNILDLNAALQLVREFNEPAAAIIKHTNPCGAATGKALTEAYRNALDTDRMSAFGSIVGFNGLVDKALAELIVKEADFVECIIAPSFDTPALAVLAQKKNLRAVELKDFKTTFVAEKDFKKVAGGMLVQDRDDQDLMMKDFKLVTEKKPTVQEMASLYFGWKVVKHVRSNAIVLAQGTATVGIGAGQMSRVDSVMIAATKAGQRAKGAALASDAFFPKDDSIEYAHKAGITCIIQPGGSIRDGEVVNACNKYGIAMVFTGMRHFKH
ncbi:MAG: bifunctional phosphoribosylaminoimidazolecarboxamide formyltransferase/IMP cyclohydrolase [Candidatus Omnitrophica bacterium]|nr:bifunctional phosphoribosylaminoimidazolecarboxamide formyltransferase/IMP cyclohydrolase [Candidatus Omnitrophota bacterium]